jgi:hypothetical protein
VQKIDLEEQSRNNSLVHGMVAEARNSAWNALKSPGRSILFIKTGIPGEINHTRSQIRGFGMYHFMGGENAQINSEA